MIIHELKTIQEEHGYLPAEELQALSRRLNVPLYRLHGVASFYPHFRLQPPPAVDVQVCSDIACFLRGATDVHAIVQTAADSLGADGYTDSPHIVPRSVRRGPGHCD